MQPRVRLVLGFDPRVPAILQDAWAQNAPPQVVQSIHSRDAGRIAPDGR